jgi:hypothetical protein
MKIREGYLLKFYCKVQLEEIFKSKRSLNLFKKGDTAEFESFLHDVIGFFVIESVVVNTTNQNFLPLAKAETSWDDAVTRIDGLIIKSLEDCTDPALFTAIKKSIILFIHTLEGYRYSPDRLGDLLKSLFDRYASLLKGECDKKIALVIEKDEYAPMIVESRQELENIHTVYALDYSVLPKSDEYDFLG